MEAIEAHFSRLDAAVEALKRTQANLRRYRLLERILAERRRYWEEAEWARLVEKAQKKVAQDRRKAAGQPSRISDVKPEEWQAVPETAYASHLPKNDRWKQKYQEPEPPDLFELPALPEGWHYTTVDQTGDISEQIVLTGPFGSNLGREDFVSSGVPVLTIGCLTDQGSTYDKAAFITEAKATELERYRVRVGDLLFS